MLFLCGTPTSGADIPNFRFQFGKKISTPSLSCNCIGNFIATIKISLRGSDEAREQIGFRDVFWRFCFPNGIVGRWRLCRFENDEMHFEMHLCSFYEFSTTDRGVLCWYFVSSFYESNIIWFLLRISINLEFNLLGFYPEQSLNT